MHKWEEQLSQSKLKRAIQLLEKALLESQEARLDLYDFLPSPGVRQALDLISNNNDRVEDAMDLIKYVKSTFKSEEVEYVHH